MIDPLGQRSVTLLRYTQTTYAGGGRMAVPTPSSSVVTLTVNAAPERVSIVNGEGLRQDADVVVVGYVELLAADDASEIPGDRLVIDGETFELRKVVTSAAFEDQPESWWAAGMRVQPFTFAPVEPTAPTNVIPPAILGSGDVLTAWVGLWDGTLPIEYALSWLLDDVEISTSTSVARPSAGRLILSVTASNEEGSATAQSQPLDEGGGPVDCEVTCADTIAAAVLAATTPLLAEIAQLEIDLAEAIAERDALQALYDAALITIAERDAEIVILNATINSLTAQLAAANAAILLSKGWRNYGLIAPVSITGASISRDPSTGILTITHSTDAGVDPGDATTLITWALQHVDGTAATGLPVGPYLIEVIGTPSAGVPSTEMAIALTDSSAIEGVGGWGLYGGFLFNAPGTRRFLRGVRTSGGAWGRAAGALGGATAGHVRWGSSRHAGAVGVNALIQPITLTNNDWSTPANNSSSTTATFAWGTSAPLMSHLHLAVWSGAITCQIRVWASPAILPEFP